MSAKASRAFETKSKFERQSLAARRALLFISQPGFSMLDKAINRIYNVDFITTQHLNRNDFTRPVKRAA